MVLRTRQSLSDPPYYDNIGYSDLSDFFYVWLRRSLGPIYPSEFSTVITPKEPELVAAPQRFGGEKKRAEEHFERGMAKAFALIRERACDDVPVTLYYAFKQVRPATADTVWSRRPPLVGKRCSPA